MDIEFDKDKNEWNVEVRGIPFDLVEEFNFFTASFEIDDRKNYGETRVRSLGFIKDRLYSLVFTERNEKMRVISLRKANYRERNKYEKESKS